MEEISPTNRKYQPLQVLWYLFVCPCLKAALLAPIHSFTKQTVPSMYQESEVF